MSTQTYRPSLEVGEPPTEREILAARERQFEKFARSLVRGDLVRPNGTLRPDPHYGEHRTRKRFSRGSGHLGSNYDPVFYEVLGKLLESHQDCIDRITYEAAGEFIEATLAQRDPYDVLTIQIFEKVAEGKRLPLEIAEGLERLMPRLERRISRDPRTRWLEHYLFHPELTEEESFRLVSRIVTAWNKLVREGRLTNETKAQRRTRVEPEVRRRLAAGESQRSIERACGVSQSTVSRIKNACKSRMYPESDSSEGRFAIETVEGVAAMTAAQLEVLSRLDLIECRLAETLEGLDDAVTRIRERFPNDVEVASAVERFLSRALDDAA